MIAYRELDEDPPPEPKPKPTPLPQPVNKKSIWTRRLLYLKERRLNVII